MDRIWLFWGKLWGIEEGSWDGALGWRLVEWFQADVFWGGRGVGFWMGGGGGWRWGCGFFWGEG